MFSAQHPLITIDQRIKKISTNRIVTNKIRSPVNQNLNISGEDVNLRGNEGLSFLYKYKTPVYGIKLRHSDPNPEILCHRIDCPSFEDFRGWRSTYECTKNPIFRQFVLIAVEFFAGFKGNIL